jgi:CelD/BcsL family acetyltransferase involved in cellulose biosynthesis
MAAIGFVGTRGSRAAEAPMRIASRSARIDLLLASEAAAIAGEWRALASEAVEENHFFLPDVVLPATRHFGKDVRILTVRDGGGALIALAPVTATRLGRIAPALRVWSHHYGPFGVPLVAGGDLVEAAACLVKAANTLILPDLPLDSPVANALTLAAERAGRMVAITDPHERAALLQACASGDLRASLPTRRRKEFARQMRRLADLGPVAIESVAAPGATTATFEEFLALEAAGWKGRGETAILSSPAISAFAREVVARRAADGGVRIDTLRFAGKPIAMVVSFLAGASAWTWKIAFDEAFARFSPGAQIMLELPQHLFAHGKVARIDSLAAAGHPMIDHLWHDRIRIGTLVIGPGGPLQRLAILSVESEIRARALARRLRDRLQHRTHKETEA